MAPAKNSESIDFPISNEVLSHHDIFAEINSDASKLEPLLQITPEQRQLLLLKFNWDIESLKNSIEEYADTNSFLLENGVCPENTISVNKKSECSICCARGRVLGLQCRHMACANCWNTYIKTKIKAGQCLLGCMDFGCPMLIPDEMLEEIHCSAKLKISLRKLIKNSHISNSSNLAWCEKKCGKAVRRSNYDTGTCSCGSTFCFLCRSDAHFPATCRQFRAWEDRRSTPDEMAFSWISLNTRECPRCFVLIQKNGGCNHMRCTACRHEYCWNCSENWRTHNFSDCKKVDIRSRLIFRTDSPFLAQPLLRFENHKQCLKREQQVATGFKFRNILTECRQILMNSYIFGYYLKDGIYSTTLKKHQQKLEIAVRELASQWNVYYGENIKNTESGRRALKLVQECLTLRNALLDHCAEGKEHEDLEGRSEQQGTEPLQATTKKVKRATTGTYDLTDINYAFILCLCLICAGYCGWIFISKHCV